MTPETEAVVRDTIGGAYREGFAAAIGVIDKRIATIAALRPTAKDGLEAALNDAAQEILRSMRDTLRKHLATLEAVP